MNLGDPVAGKKFAAAWCASCHQIGPGFPAGNNPAAPPFDEIANSGRLSRDFVFDWVRYPHAPMPAFQFSIDIVRNLVSYIFSLRRGNGSPGDGGSLATLGPGLVRYSSGTGFFVSGKGHVLSAGHLMDHCERITIEQPGAFTGDARLVSLDRKLDLALLKSNRNIQNFAPLALGADPVVGSQVIAFGYPLTGTLSETGNLTVGYVAALSGVRDNADQFQMSTPLQFGSSGSPILDPWGRVVGVGISRLVAMSSSAAGPQGINFAIKSRKAGLFLIGQGVVPKSAGRLEPLSPAGLARKARDFTVRVNCLR